MSTDVTYVLATCAVAARHPYLRRHLEHLRVHDEAYARIVVVNSGAGPQVRALTSALLPTALVLDRPNEGLSYGAFQAAIASYPSAFYLLMEDDYLFVPGASSLLLEYLEQHPRCSMYAGGVTDHVAVFAGAVRREGAAHWLTQAVHGGKEYGVAGYRNQVEVSHMLEHDGWELHDWLDRWASAFWITADRCVRWYSRPPSEHTRLFSAAHEADVTRPSLILPVQALDGPVRVSDGRRWHHGTLGLDGRLTC